MLRNSSNLSVKESADIISRDNARREINVNSNMRKMEVNLLISKPNCVQILWKGEFVSIGILALLLMEKNSCKVRSFDCTCPLILHIYIKYSQIDICDGRFKNIIKPMSKPIKYNNPSEFGPWIPQPNPNQQTIEYDITSQKIPTLKPNKTIRLPKIEMGSTTKKMEMRLSKQSLMIPKQKKSRVRETGMNGSVLGRTKAKGSRRYGNNSILVTGRYHSMSVNLDSDKQLQRKISTIDLGDPQQPALFVPEPHQPKKYSLNAESARKRCLKSVINEMKAHQDLMNLYILNKKGRMRMEGISS